MIDYVTPGGRVVTHQEIEARIKNEPKQSRPKSDAPQGYHKGWRVVGHAANQMAHDKAIAEEEWSNYKRMTVSERSERWPGGKGAPKQWDEAFWRRTAPMKAVRSKPYEIYEAAQECMRLAAKDGWTELRIDTLAKGEAPHGLFCDGKA